MNASEIDELFKECTDENWDRVLEIIGEDSGSKDSKAYISDNYELILKKLLKRFEKIQNSI